MNIIITAGGTKEAIDKVRHITNMSSGSLGREILSKAQLETSIEKIFFLAPQTAMPVINTIASKVILVRTDSVGDLYSHLKSLLTTEKIDAVIHSMAVSDFTVDSVFTFEELAKRLFDRLSSEERVSEEVIFETLTNTHEYNLDNSSKISSKSDFMAIALKPTPKVIKNIKEWSPNTMLMGFKLLEAVSNDELIRVAREQIDKNGCDYVWANDIRRIRQSGHQGLLITKEDFIAVNGKPEISKAIVNTILNHKKGE